LTIRSGESFERVIAYIMKEAGFVIREQPHDVRVGGETVGDFDILAIDPKSEITVAVSCKEWKDQQPHSKEFNHLKELMDIENITHGVVAWTHIPTSVYPLMKIAEDKGYRFVVLDLNRYEELHNHMLAGEKERIEEFFRSGLGLVPAKTPTLGQEIALRRIPTHPSRTLHCRNLLPMEYRLDPPSYLKNAYFKPHEARLLVVPYLHVILDIHREKRIPGTGELAGSLDAEVTSIYHGVSGKLIRQEDPVFQVIREHFTEAKSEEIIEDDFIAEVCDTSINKQDMIWRAKVDAAREIEPVEVR